MLDSPFRILLHAVYSATKLDEQAVSTVKLGPLFERHRTAPNLLANTTGVKKVDGNTVYRLGSVSKNFTVVAWLAELGDVHWNQPVTNFILELAGISAQARSKPFDEVQQTAWENITIGALASQVSGVGRDCM